MDLIAICFLLLLFAVIILVCIGLLFSNPLIGIPLCAIVGTMIGFLIRAAILDHQFAQKYKRDNPGQTRNYISLDPLNRNIIVPIIVVVNQSNQNPSATEHSPDNSNPNSQESNGGVCESGRDQIAQSAIESEQ